MTKEEYKRSKTEDREQKLSNKMNSQYCRVTSDDIDKEKKWLWLKKR